MAEEVLGTLLSLNRHAHNVPWGPDTELHRAVPGFPLGRSREAAKCLHVQGRGMIKMYFVDLPNETNWRVQFSAAATHSSEGSSGQKLDESQTSSVCCRNKTGLPDPCGMKSATHTKAALFVNGHDPWCV